MGMPHLSPRPLSKTPTADAKLSIALERIKSAQEYNPHMKSLMDFITDKKLPTDRLARVELLQTAQTYDVNSQGLLCKVRPRGKQASLGLDMCIVVPESIRGKVVEGCHLGVMGHDSVLKTYQRVRERFYWPGMFADVARYI